MQTLPFEQLLNQLQDNLDERRHGDPKTSYVALLHSKGLNKILEKVGEEATEVVLAAKDVTATQQSRQEMVGEAADLFFHTFVALSHLDIPLHEVFAELHRRSGLSGLEEKASRNQL